MGLSSVVTVWVGALLLLTFLMSLATGKDIARLGGLVLMVGFLYMIFFVSKYLVSRKRTKLKLERNGM